MVFPWAPHREQVTLPPRIQGWTPGYCVGHPASAFLARSELGAVATIPFICWIRSKKFLGGSITSPNGFYVETGYPPSIHCFIMFHPQFLTKLRDLPSEDGIPWFFAPGYILGGPEMPLPGAAGENSPSQHFGAWRKPTLRCHQTWLATENRLGMEVYS